MAKPGRGHNPLTKLFDEFCSDKGTHYLSRHHYSEAYHSILETRRVDAMIEIGIGEDTAPSIASWKRYFPDAQIYALDITKQKDFNMRAETGITERLRQRQRAGGCEHDERLWDRRAHLSLDTDATRADDLARANLPKSAQLIIDDGSHAMRDQEATLELLWPTLSEGGLYIVEDVFVGALPWRMSHAQDAPTQNSNCGHECFFPQRPAEHPLFVDRFNVGGRDVSARPALRNATTKIMQENDWFWVLTGMHQGGGLDCSLVIRKKGVPFAGTRAAAALGPPPQPPRAGRHAGITEVAEVPHGSATALFVCLLLGASLTLNAIASYFFWNRRHHYRSLRD
tara:strand:- start:703 stop:1722 length:1020 start_codon:yes stop_codon:yes gene_type:complete